MEISAIILFCVIIYTLGLGITSYMFEKDVVSLIDEDETSIIHFLGLAVIAVFWPVTWLYMGIMWVFRKK